MNDAVPTNDGEAPDGADEIQRLREALNRDKTGLAQALSQIRDLAVSWSWLGEDGHWATYAVHEQSIAVLRSEAARLMDAVDRVALGALLRSGALANAALLGNPLPPFQSPEQQRIDELTAETERLRLELAKRDGQEAVEGSKMCTDANPCPTCECSKVLRDVWEKAEAQGMKCVYCGGPCSDGCMLDKWVNHHETEVWTQDQVDSLNAWQDCGRYYPFTSDDGQVLVATRHGWVERIGGPVVQTWAHTFMLDWSWRSRET